MNQELAKEYIKKNARPLEKATYRYYFENGSKAEALEELRKYQNEDGGFGHALELDNWNPNSNPIATNDAIIILHRLDAMNEAKDMVDGIIRYIKSHDSFDESRRQWQFCIESTKDYPHAIWWEKDGDGVNPYNPTVSMAAFMVCYGENNAFYQGIIREAFEFLQDESNEISGDGLKCYILCYLLLKEHGITEIVDLSKFKDLIHHRISNIICKEIDKYGVEYVPVPSDFFIEKESDFLDEEITKLIQSEMEVLGKLQKDDGGFDISWEWYTPYTEFAQARDWWRPRLTIDKLLFVRNYGE